MLKAGTLPVKPAACKKSKRKSKDFMSELKQLGIAFRNKGVTINKPRRDEHDR